jgi:hypothetical protein
MATSKATSGALASMRSDQRVDRGKRLGAAADQKRAAEAKTQSIKDSKPSPAPKKASTGGKVTRAASTAAPELAPILQAGAKAHGKVLGGKGKLSSSNPNRLLLAEFLICLLILGAGTIVAPSGSKDGIPRLMTRGSGLCVLFFILALVSGGGPGARKSAAALGGLVTVGYLVLSSDAVNVVKWLAGFFGGAAYQAGSDLASASDTEAQLIAQQDATTTSAAGE